MAPAPEIGPNHRFHWWCWTVGSAAVKVSLFSVVVNYCDHPEIGSPSLFESSTRDFKKMVGKVQSSPRAIQSIVPLCVNTLRLRFSRKTEEGSRDKKAHIRALVCALVCASKLVCALVCVLVCDSKLV